MRADWIKTTLDKLLTSSGIFVDGDWIESKDQDQNGEVRLLQLADIGDGKFKNKSDRYITRVKSRELNCTYLEKDDILIARMPDPLGRACLFPYDKHESYVTVVDVAIVRLDQKFIETKFILHMINAPQFRNEVDKLKSGSTRKRISRKNLASLNLPLAPLLEQKAIVDKIEALFSELDKGVESLQKAKTQLKTYRQSVLKKAFEGKFTNSVEKITIKPLGEILKIVSGNTPKGLSETSNTGKIQFYKVSDMNLDGNEKEMRSSNISLTNDEVKKLRIKIFPAGTIIFPKRGGAILTNKKRLLSQDSSFDLNLMGIVPNEKIISKYIYYFFSSIDLRKICDGSAVPQINNKNIEPLAFPLCSSGQQAKIVEEIESRLSVCDKIEATIEESLAKAEALRQSILKKAFEGKLLGAKELENIHNHPEYESAQRLLERIKNKELEPAKASKTEPTKAPKKLSTTDTHAGVIAKVVKAHEEHPEYLKLLSHVKCEKIAHLVESHIGVPLGRMAVKDAAGPDDYNHLMKVEHRAKMLGYFEIKTLDIGHSYICGRNIQKAIEQLENSVEKEQAVRIDALVNTFLKLTLQQAEIVATVYAGWNNLLLEGKNPTDEEIVYESRENWSKRKLDIERWKFFKALEWMRRDDIGLTPRGDGTKVEKPQKAKK